MMHPVSSFFRCFPHIPVADAMRRFGASQKAPVSARIEDQQLG
jgi:hypothetical protein